MQPTAHDIGVRQATWWSQVDRAGADNMLVAYFSMEFGVDQRLPIYAGGLGVLSGDHLKAAGELGVPLVGVGLFYRGGYFHQGVDAVGRQKEVYASLDAEALGLVREPVSIELDLADTTVEAAVWRYDAGSVPLYLLEAGFVTDALYAGDREHRIEQELVLGVGGVRALVALGLEPTVFHVNEGHAAFLTIERARRLVEQGREPDAALDLVRRTTVFTTHTPVPAGNEVFEDERVLRHVAHLAGQAGLPPEQLLALGRSEALAGFGLTPLALRLSAYRNAVSVLHAEVAREMWASLWPDETPPIDHVTNGVHLGTWLASELAEVLLSIGVRPDAPPDRGRWEAVRRLDPDVLWRTHAMLKQRLANLFELDDERMTIGLARRFATYKRVGLVFTDLDRLLALPVQIVVAGKAHPQDEAGKDVMQRIVQLSRDPATAGRVVFVQDYDIGIAQTLIPGCDVWLNTPRPPYEASGTSGMKAAVNGVLNLSVLDGWWAEAYDRSLGWAIAGRSDEEDAAELYRLLEEEVLPAFADRSRWVEMMKESIARLAPRFSMQRTVIEYTQRYYLSTTRVTSNARPS